MPVLGLFLKRLHCWKFRNYSRHQDNLKRIEFFIQQLHILFIFKSQPSKCPSKYAIHFATGLINISWLGRTFFLICCPIYLVFFLVFINFFKCTIAQRNDLVDGPRGCHQADEANGNQRPLRQPPCLIYDLYFSSSSLLSFYFFYAFNFIFTAREKEENFC